MELSSEGLDQSVIPNPAPPEEKQYSSRSTDLIWALYCRLQASQTRQIQRLRSAVNHNEDSGSHDSDMILFKQFLYRTVQGALNLEESTLLEFGNDGDRDCAFPHRYNPFIVGPADDIGD